MKTFLKDQKEAGGESSSENQKAVADAPKEYKGIDQPMHLTLRQMYHIFDHFTQETPFGYQFKDVREELDQAKRDITLSKMDHEALKDKCAESFKAQEERIQAAENETKRIHDEFSQKLLEVNKFTYYLESGMDENKKQINFCNRNIKNIMVENKKQNEMIAHNKKQNEQDLKSTILDFTQRVD